MHAILMHVKNINKMHSTLFSIKCVIYQKRFNRNFARDTFWSNNLSAEKQLFRKLLH